MKKLISFLFFILFLFNCGGPSVPSNYKRPQIKLNYLDYTINYKEIKKDQYDRFSLKMHVDKNHIIFTDMIKSETLHVVTVISADTILTYQYYNRYLTYSNGKNLFLPDNRSEYVVNIASMRDTALNKNTLLYVEIQSRIDNNESKTIYRETPPSIQKEIREIRIYNAKPGDTWEKIAREFNTTKESLMYINPGKPVPSGTIKLF